MRLCSTCTQNFTPRVDVDIASIRGRLRSESGPASVQPDEIRVILRDAQRDLEDYERELHRLESRRIFVVTQHERLREFMSQAQFLLSPIRKVPDETLRFIFDGCCDMNHFEVIAEARKLDLSLRPAMVLSSVCSRWRRVGLSLPSIWSRISLKHVTFAVFDFELEKLYEQVEQDLEIFISRSQQWPLTVCIELSGSEDLQICPPLSLLVWEYPRWRSFTFRGVAQMLGELFTSTGYVKDPDIFSKLVELDLPDRTSEDLMNIFGPRAPNLRSLEIEGIPVGDEAFPWAQLLHLKLDPNDLTFHSTGKLIKCTSLHSLDIMNYMTGEADILLSPRTYSTIETLIVRDICRADPLGFDSVFPLITCPSLKTLHLQATRRCSSSYWDNFNLFITFVQRSSFPLTVLSIGSLSLSDSSVVYLLSHIPTLQDLTLNDANIPRKYSPITSQLLESLHSYRTSSLRRQMAPLVPRLRSLTLYFGGPSFKDEIVVDTVKSRWMPTQTGCEVDCLRAFTINFQMRIEIPNVYDTLEHLEKDGMRVAILWKKTHLA